MIHKWKVSAIVAIGCLMLCPVAMIAQQRGAALARSELALGEEVRLTGDYEAALKHFRAAIDAAPDMIEAHEQFSQAMLEAELGRLRKDGPQRDAAAISELANKAVADLYRQWSREHPDKVLYRYFAVRFGYPFADLAAEAEYKRMTQTDPKFAPPYLSLAEFAVMRGDEAGQREYLRKASELRPENSFYWLQYIDTFRESDPAAFLKLADEFAQRFPHDRWTLATVLQAAECAPTPQSKITYLERTLDLVAPGERYSVVSKLCAAYEQSNPAKAAELATKELKAVRANASASKFAVTSLERLSAYYGDFAKAWQLLAAGKADEAAAVGMKIPRSTAPLVVLKSQILTAQGKPREAYELLVAEAVAGPNAIFLQALEPVALKIAKTPDQVPADILAASIAKAKPLQDFELPDLAGGTKSTADYRGKVLYLNYWSPG